jgi:hypothetical protein
MNVDVDESYGRLVDALVSGLADRTSVPAKETP